MTSRRMILACSILMSAALLTLGQDGIPSNRDIAAAVTLNSSRYDVTVLDFASNVGDTLTSVVINYNSTVVSHIVSASYSMFGSYRQYINIDSNGTVTLRRKLPSYATYTVQFSVLVSVSAFGRHDNVNVFLSGSIALRSVGVVRFNESRISTSIAAFTPVNTQIHDLRFDVEIARSYVNFVNLAFFGYSSYVNVHYNGKVTLRRELSPGTYSVYIRLHATVAYKNGTLRTLSMTTFLRMTVLGCRLIEEGSVEWPSMGSCGRAQHVCSKYHPLLKGGMVRRHCNSTGVYSVPDFSCCCVKNDASNPFALVWLTFSGTRASFYMSSLDSIRRTVSSLFGSSATAISLFSAYRSNRYYGFSMSFTVTLRNLNQTQSALRLLRNYRRFGGAYLRSESESRGIRAFIPSSCCESYNYTFDDLSSVLFTRIPFCCDSATGPCNCSPIGGNCSATVFNRGSCSACNVRPMPSDPQCPSAQVPLSCALTTSTVPPNTTTTSIIVTTTTTPSPPTPPDCITFNASGYNGWVNIGAAERGQEVLTVGLVECSSHISIIRNYTAHYGLNGYYSDYFDIGKLTGVITTSGLPLSIRQYVFYVSAFVDITYTNGTRVKNFTETNVRIGVHGGIRFNQISYRISAPVDSAVNTSSILDLGAEVIIDPTYVKNLSLTFTRVSNSNFGVTKEGDIYPRVLLSAGVSYYVAVFYSYRILDMKSKIISYNTYIGVYVTVKGCRQEEGGSYVWPRTHSCGIVKVSCSHFDSSFDDYGQVRRQCTKDGKWLTPDFSQCRLKARSKPFVLLWFTFRSVYTRHWTSVYTPGTLRELRSFMSEFPVTRFTVHHNKESKVLYGFVQSFKAELQPGSTLDGSLLQALQDTITTARRIGGRTKYTLPYTAGVLGFSTSDRCIQYDITSNVTDYTPVCVVSDTASCTCKKVAPRVNSMCCTNKGQINRTLEMCGGSGKRIKPSIVKASLAMTVKRSGPSMLVSWTLSKGDTPDYYDVAFSSNEHENHVTVDKSQSSVNVAGLLPGTSYMVSVRGYYSNGESTSSQQVIWIEDKTILKFQIFFSSVVDCPKLKARTENLRRTLVKTISAGCQCSFSLDRLALVVDQCPYGKPSDNMAMMRGWIYDTSDSPDQKYFPYMQRMASKDVSITAGDMKLKATNVCDITKSGTTCPAYAGTSQPLIDGGSSTAGTVFGIIIGIVGCALLVAIIIVLVLRFKNGKNESATPEKVPPALRISMSETNEGVATDDDKTQLQKDF